MIIRFFKTFWRNSLKNKQYSSINIIGLSVAFACSFLMLLFIIHELSYDRYNTKRDSIFRILAEFQGNGKTNIIASGSILLKDALLEEYPEIENGTRIYDYGLNGDKQLVKIGDTFIEEKNMKMVDNGFFDIFTVDLVSGSSKEPLQTKQSILLSQKAAKKYFGNENPVGKTLLIKNNYWNEVVFEVSGVFKNLPTNSTIAADIIGNFKQVENRYKDRGWYLSNIQTYIFLNNQADINNLEKKFNAFAQKHHPSLSRKYSAQSLNDIYFKSGHLTWYSLPQGNMKHIYTLSVISFLIVLIASINYVILSTANGMGRNLEIGIKKVVGASRKSIIAVIISESVLFMLLVLPLSGIISELILPLFNRLLGRSMEIHYLSNWPYLLCLTGTTLFIGLLSGAFISIYLTKLAPDTIIRSGRSFKIQKNNLSRGLLTLQLIVFVTLFIFSGVIYRQIKYIGQKDLGFEKDNLLIINPPHLEELKNADQFVTAVKQLSEVSSASQISAGIFTPIFSTGNYINPEFPLDTLNMRVFEVDYAFFDAFNVQFTTGSGFEQGDMAVQNAVVLNESALKLLKLNPSNDKTLIQNGNVQTIKGVVKDFNIGSLRESIVPLAIKFRGDEMLCQVAIRHKPNINIPDFTKKVEILWDELGPKGQFDYYFMEDKLASQYNDDRSFGETISLFSLLAIIISSLGLFGISLFTSQQKNKEIGIRKTLGASIIEILMLFVRLDMFVLLFANIFAWPIAYYLANNWLKSFAYQIEVPIFVFILALFVSFAIVCLTVSYSFIKVATRNPVEALRYE